MSDRMLPGGNITHWEPRVMRQINGKQEFFAVHEVYFTGEEVTTFTEDALSPRASTLAGLREVILHLLSSQEDEVQSGDLGYVYDREYVEEWIDSLEAPVIDFC